MKIIRVTDELRERLASVEHERWSQWMKYLFNKCTEQSNGCVLIPEWAARIWTRKMVTSYDKLTEEEKESDRTEVDKTFKACQVEDVLQIITRAEVDEKRGFKQN
jgi:hypothetical protein